MNWQDLIKHLGYFGIALSAIVWLAKLAIERWFSLNLKKYEIQLELNLQRHKTQFELEANKEIEKLKAALVIAAKENEIRFSKLHEKRGENIAELHCKINDAEIAVEMFYRRLKIRQGGKLTDEIIEESRSKAVQRCNDAFEFYRGNELYFSEKLASKISNVIFSIRGTGLLPDPSMASNGTQLLDEWRKKTNEIGALQREIASEFRVLLGVRD